MSVRSSRTATFVDLEIIPAAALVVHPDDGVLDANAEARSLLFRSSPDTSLSRDLSREIDARLEGDLQVLARRSGENETAALLWPEVGANGRRRIRAKARRMESGSALVILQEVDDTTTLEETLAQSELLYETFLTQAPTGIVHLDAAGNVTYENEQFRQIFGRVGHEHWITHRADEIMELDEAARRSIATLIVDGTEFCLPRVRYVVDDDHMHTLFLAGSAIRHPDGSRVGSVLIILDQTEAARQDAIIEIANRFRIAEIALRKAASADADEEEFLQRASRVMAEAIGVEQLAIVVSIPHDDAFSIRARWPQSIAPKGDAPKTTDVVLPSEDDENFWTPFMVADEVAGFVTFRDRRSLATSDRQHLLGHVDELVRVFERQWAAVQLGYRYRLAVNSIDDGLFNYLLAPGGERRYLFATRQFEGLFGKTSGEVTDPESDGSWLVGGLDGSGRTALENHHAALEAGIPSRTVFRFERPDGTVRWLREDASPQRESSGRITVTGIVVDVTEQKEAEQMLEVARAAAEAEARRKTSFIATMSHELRTPLGTVHGFAEMIRRELQEQPPDSAVANLVEFALAIEERSGELLTVVEDLLDLSNLESGLLALSRAPVQLGDLCRELAARYRTQLDEKGLRAELRADDAVAAVGDPVRIRKILDRIMSNAVKFTERGSIVITVGTTDDVAYVEVVDRGVGMTPEQLERIFDPFVQGDDRLNRSFEGVGLGLTVAKRLATAMGGAISATSEPGAGTAIRLTLPLDR